MSKIKIEGETKTEKAELEKKVVNLVKGRLIAIKKELESIKVDLDFLANKYSMTNDEFLKKFETGELGDDQDFFLWEGSVKMKNSFLKEQEELREIL